MMIILASPHHFAGNKNRVNISCTTYGTKLTFGLLLLVYVMGRKANAYTGYMRQSFTSKIFPDFASARSIHSIVMCQFEGDVDYIMTIEYAIDGP